MSAQSRHVFGVFETTEAARALIGTLSPYVQQDRISVVTKPDQLPEYAAKQYETDNIVDGTLIGAAIGGVLGIGAAMTTALYPTAGNLLITLGPLAGAAYGTWSGGAIGALIDLGISPPNAKYFHDAVESGKLLLCAEVCGDNQRVVEQLFRDYGADAVLTR
ncbi:DUF1269 domain-containing protein [Tumebacillus flagellatus]|uniref:DUF1269 domain-containing protein n=1 Tax=Tumebacillus flagellatus TaxID=1157490 RepID=A0A074MH60_9BACL|nr:DUF1269 domain-containing protein [Tumebacillus flagellatus]KEO85037.1 hypothetical protein EL26_00275 [Tumebacillus flagellatus]